MADRQQEDGGGRRLDNPDDLVRREVAAALGNEGTVVIPVLTGDAEMPKPDELPDDLKALATRNAAVVRADASFDAQMEALIDEIVKHIPSLRRVVRYGKRGLAAIAAVVVLGLAALIYGLNRAPEDLSSISWSTEHSTVDVVDFGETQYQGLLLRTSEAAPIVSGSEVEKYDLVVEIEEAAEHTHDVINEEGFDHNAQHANLLKATVTYWQDLPQNIPAYIDVQDGPFLALEGGSRFGTAKISVSYINKNGDSVSTQVKEVHVMAPRKFERDANAKLNEVLDLVQDNTLNDQDILEQSDSMLNGTAVAFQLDNGTTMTYNDVLSEDQRNVLGERVAAAKAAVDAFDTASRMSASLYSLADRREAWEAHRNASIAMGRVESPQMSRADQEIAGIESFANSRMDVNSALTCTSVSSSDCVQPKNCFAANESIISWARLKVHPESASIVHRLVDSNGSVVNTSDATSVARNTGAGYRTSKSLRANNPGKYSAQIVYDGTVVSSIYACVGECGPCHGE